jgi:acetolactate synthase-1/2/3 large subunit
MSDAKMASLAETLVRRGLAHAFGLAGSGSSMALIMELEARGVAYHGVSHEAAGAIMAGTVARASGRPSVSISIKGPGAVNMLPGVAYNHFEGNPALSVSESYGSDVGAHRMHKRLDHPALFSSITKAFSGLADDGAGTDGMLDLAFAEVPGPVHIDLAGLSQAQPSTTGKPLNAPLVTDVTLPANVRKPAVIAGSLAIRRGWGEALAALKIPVFTTASAKGIIDEGSPFSAGVFTGVGGELAPERSVLLKADIVIGIGLRNTEVIAANPLAAGSLLIDRVDGGLSDGFDARLVLAGDEVALGALQLLHEYHWGEAEIASAVEPLRAELSTGWLPGGCFNALNALGWDHGLVLDTGSFCTVGEHAWLASKERPFWGSSNGRFMGSAIPTAIGASLARPGLPVFCVVGDGGLRPYGAEIGMAVELGLPICFALMSDGRYGSVVGAPNASVLRPFSERAVNIARPSWWRTAESLGCPALAVETASEFATAVESWDRSGPLFIEAAFDQTSYAAMTGRVRP